MMATTKSSSKAEETERLAAKYSEKKSPELRTALIESAVWIVKLVCGKLTAYTSGVLEMDDLCSFGVMGLIDAVDKFDASKGVKFSTYASVRIKGAVLDEVRKYDVLPRTAREKKKAVDRIESEIRSENASLKPGEMRCEIAKRMGVTVEEIDDLEANVARWDFVWLDDSDDEEGDLSASKYAPISTIGNPEEAIDKDGIGRLKEKLSEALSELTEKERAVIQLIYYEELTQKEAAHVLGVSEGRTSQLLGKALSKLKVSMSEYEHLLSP